MRPATEPRGTVCASVVVLPAAGTGPCLAVGGFAERWPVSLESGHRGRSAGYTRAAAHDRRPTQRPFARLLVAAAPSECRSVYEYGDS